MTASERCDGNTESAVTTFRKGQRVRNSATWYQLIGFREIGRLLTGRYHRPRREAHLFAMVDLKGSTEAAERLGDLRFHGLLDAFFADIAYAAAAAGADIHKYVGDEAILVWPSNAPAGIADAAGFPFLVANRIASRADWYRREFGIVPAFRAALHGGDVVAGEIGSTRRELAFVGDALNTTARLMDVARDLDRDVVASASLFAGAAPAGLAIEPQPPQRVRGKREPLDVVALRRRDR